MHVGCSSHRMCWLVPAHFGRRAISSRYFSSQTPIDWLASFTNFEQRGVPDDAGTDTAQGFNLSRMHHLLETLDSPHRAWPAIHVAGTKGKGTTAVMLSSILRAAGRRVGTYTSPHVASLHERISVDLQPIEPAALDALVERYRSSIHALQSKQLDGALTHFEVLTALAFRHFADAAVDIAVVEAGLGGARDATNVFDPKTLHAAVITPVGNDHAAALGGSLESIASTKAGIMKAQRPVVLSRQPHADAAKVLLKHAESLGCILTRADDAIEGVAGRIVAESPVGEGPQQAKAWQTGTLRLHRWVADALDPQLKRTEIEVKLQLVGSHQLDNTATAVATAACLQRDPSTAVPGLNLEAVVKGLENASLPGRFQVCRLAAGPLIVLDGAHTQESAEALSQTLRETFPSNPIALVVAMATDKAHKEVCAALRAIRPCLAVFTEVPIGGSVKRSAPPGALVAAWQAAGMARGLGGAPIRCRELIQASLPAAVAKAVMELKARPGGGGDGVVVVTGSLHGVGAALKHLEYAHAGSE